jgi:excisionase family DNA binding protein
MLTVAQAAERLEVSRALIYSLVAARKLRHERIGLKRGVIRIPDDALDEYRRSRQVGVVAEVIPVDRPRNRLHHIKLR